MKRERLPLDVVDVRPGGQDRTAFDRAELEALAASFGPTGEPEFAPIVRPMAGGRYELVAGERRTRAMRDVLGATSALFEVRELDDVAADRVMLAENTARVDLDPIDEARAYRRRLDAGATAATIARDAGRSVETVRARVALLELAEEIRHYVRTRALPLAYAGAMVGLDANRQHLALTAFNETRPTLETFRRLCGRLADEQAADSMFDVDSFLRVDDYVTAAAAEVLADRPAPEREALLDVAGVAARLGVRPATVAQWRFRGVAPAPDVELAGSPGWYVSTVDQWAAATGRRRTSSRRSA